MNDLDTFKAMLERVGIAYEERRIPGTRFVADETEITAEEALITFDSDGALYALEHRPVTAPTA